MKESLPEVKELAQPGNHAAMTMPHEGRFLRKKEAPHD